MAQNRDAIHILRGSEDKIAGIKPAAGQPLYDKTNNILYIGNGTDSPGENLKPITVADRAITTDKLHDEAVTLAKVNVTDTSDGLSSKFVNRDTEQTITGKKIFTSDIHFTSEITVGNPDSSGKYTTGYSTILSKEYLVFGSVGKTARIDAGMVGSTPDSRKFTLPEKSGTFALTSDIPTDYVSTSKTQSQTIRSNLQVEPSHSVIIGTSTDNNTSYSRSGIIYNVSQGSSKNQYLLAFPSKTGVIALVSDIPTNYVNTTGDQTKIAGNKTFTGNITANVFYATSDKRLKENIVDYKPEKSILDIPVKEYTFIGDDKKHIGFIAQDLQEAFPELVTKRIDGYLAIEESKLIYLLIDEVKKLKEKIGE